MYDKFGRMLRIETMVNDVPFFKHCRKVEHRDGTSSLPVASMKKTSHSLPVLIDSICLTMKKATTLTHRRPEGKERRLIESAARRRAGPVRGRSVLTAGR